MTHESGINLSAHGFGRGLSSSRREMSHKVENCPFKDICLDNDYDPPYCNKCEAQRMTQEIDTLLTILREHMYKLNTITRSVDVTVQEIAMKLQQLKVKK